MEKEKEILTYDKYRACRVDNSFIGENYKTGDIVLVLHYTHTDTTWNCVQFFRAGGHDHSFGRLAQALGPRLQWDRTCVFNYLQKVLKHGNYDCSTLESRPCYFESEPGFRDDLDRHRPTRLLIMGPSHYQRNGQFTGSEAIAWDQLRRSGLRREEIRIEPVYHPYSRIPEHELFTRWRDAWENLSA